MKKILIGILTLFLSLPLISSAQGMASENKSPIPSLAPMLKKVTPAIVNIAVEKVIAQKPSHDSHHAPISPNLKKTIGVGSGIIIDAEHGLIVTNAHVVRNQKVMLVTLKDGRRYHAKLVGTADSFDIAIIQIPAKHLRAIEFGNSDKLEAGDFVVAIGSPFGLTQTVTSGVISALNRATPQIEGFQNFIQTDAPINPGNSGGALIDMHGKIIGVNTAILSGSMGNIGIGFSIPSNMVKSVADQLIKYGKVEPGMFGVLAQNLSPELADALKTKSNKGVVVTQVVPNSPAAKSGVKPKDIILEVNGVPVNSAAQLRIIFGIMRPGTKTTALVLQNTQKKTLKVVVGDPKTMLKQQQVPFLSGLRLQPFKDMEPDGSTLSGLIALDVGDNSAAALAGLIPGDIITTANGTDTHTLKDITTIASSKTTQILLTVTRGMGTLFLVLTR
jgi:serine protease Do